MPHRNLGVSSIAIFMMLAIVGCGSSKESGSTGAAQNTFGLGEFTITPPTNTLHAGKVSLTANNEGGEEHELVIVKAKSVASLPTKADGSVDEDMIPAADKVGEIEDIAPQTKKSKSFELKAGAYIAFCNLVDSMMGSSPSTMHGGSGMMHDGSGTDGTTGMGHVHFAQGMSVPFTVS